MKQEFNHRDGLYFTSEATELYFEECGNKNAPILLFLHGGFGDIEDYNPLLPAFTDSYRIIGLDTRGHGASNLGTHPLTYELLQKDIENLNAFLALDKFSIVGFSDGGIVAYRLAAFSKLQIKKIVTIGAKWSKDDAKLMLQICKEMTPDSCEQMFADNYDRYNQLNHKPQFVEFAKQVLNMWTDEEDSGMPDKHICDIEIPLLAIRGNHDPLLSLGSVSALADQVSQLEFLNIPFAGHEAFKDQLEIVAYFMKIFFEKSLLAKKSVKLNLQ